MSKMKRAIMVLAVMTLALPAAAKKMDDVRFHKVVDMLVDAYNAGDYEKIEDTFDEGARAGLPYADLVRFFDGLKAEYGKIVSPGKPKLLSGNVAVYKADFERGVLDIKLVLDDRDRISGLWFAPHAPDLPAPERNTTKLSLPFSGEWFVFWGGDTKELNHHHDTLSQQYAFDFVVTGENGRDYKTDGGTNEDYYAYGREILAPGDGTVTDVIQGVRDNAPGSMNPYSGLGNAVFIQHGEYEVSVIAHFKPGSIRVRVGDRVKRGQVVGLCGNSGNSSEPHIHYHLQNTPVIQDGTGIKCYFDKVTVSTAGETETKIDYSPQKDEIISP